MTREKQQLAHTQNVDVNFAIFNFVVFCVPIAETVCRHYVVGGVYGVYLKQPYSLSIQIQ